MDAWSDSEEPQVIKLDHSQMRIPLAPEPPNAPINQATDTSAPTGVPSLVSWCLGVLAMHIEDLIELGCGDVFSWLPSSCKSTLLAVAQRRGLLTDTLLLWLADSGQPTLSLSNVKPKNSLTEQGILQALSQMPQLQFLDLTAHPITPTTLKSLAKLCPNIQVLRLVNTHKTTTEAMGLALLDILPQLEKQQNAEVDSWDQLSIENPSDLAPHRLMSLQCIVWNEMPLSIKARCHQIAPTILINPTIEEIDGIKHIILPRGCRPDVELDTELTQNLPMIGTNGLEVYLLSVAGDPNVTKDEVHIAEKFRMAYISRAQRLAAKGKREYRQEQRRALTTTLRASGGERAIRQWENEM